ncbi:MAG: aminodeoxychorismate synthase component I [Burkholderiaceae bacterium]|nr:MAG: aminodeoxychorismate synthase component I [Burkholderiaceae bacterium]
MSNAPTACLYSAHEQCWLRFTQPRVVLTTGQHDQVQPLLHQVEQAVAQGGWAVGMVSYEAAPAFDTALPVHAPDKFPLLWFALFNAVERCAQLPAPRAAHEIDWQPDITPAHYAQATARIKQHIADGDAYQVNYSFRLLNTPPLPPGEGPGVREEPCPWQLFLQLAQDQSYAAYLDLGDWALCSTSPELFFSKQGSTLISRPMKGTQPRGLSFAQDQARAAWLRQSGKNRAENLMIVDMVRNDMGRIARPGTVTVPQLFEIEQYPTVWQMTSTVQAHTDAGVTEVFRALFPPASITGAPKRQAMQIIRNLETSPRNIYTGSIGFIHGTQTQFNVAIRTVAIEKKTGHAEYGIGSGIIWDSDLADEYQECLHKAAVLKQARPTFELLESLLWTPDEGIFLAAQHLQRLQQSAQYFGWSINASEIEQRIAHAVANLPRQQHKLRLLLRASGEITLEAAPLTHLPTPYTLTLAPQPIDESNVFLYHKTTERSHYPTQEHLLWNARGEITETTIANVLYELRDQPGQWFTPPVECGLLLGCYRAWLLEQGAVQERVLLVDELERCARLQLINSVRKRWDIQLAKS